MSKLSFLKKVRDAFNSEACGDNLFSGVDSIGKRKNGNIIIRRGYFYRHGKDVYDLKMYVENTLRLHGVKYNIVDYGDTWKNFRGDGGVARGSHWWVEISPMTA